MHISIIIGADIVPTESNYSLFKSGNVEALIGKGIIDLLEKSNYTVFNLEVPLTDELSPILKCGPNLAAPTYTINGLSKINHGFFGLANNHIFDQGESGLISTINILNKAGIDYSGAGKNLSEASKPYQKVIDGIMVGIYACAEHEFSIATDAKPGANPFDPLESLDHVEKLKKNSDFVIVLYHGGKEHYRYPSPYLQKVCRKLVEKGADLVICQHSHCIGASEVWNKGTIVYGQGNFLFDHSDSDLWQTGLLIKLDIEKNNESAISNIQYIPLRKNGNTVRLAEDKDALEIINGFEGRSRDILDPLKVKKHYQDFADSILDNYLLTLSGNKSFAYRILNKITHNRYCNIDLNNRYDKNVKTAIKNFMECEAHRELLLQGIDDQLYSGGQQL